MPIFTFRVRGHVQGVGYRRFVQRQAQVEGWSGWVRNCFNGDVAGTVKVTDMNRWTAFCGELRRGPAHATVEEVVVNVDNSMDKLPMGFEIWSDAE